MVSPASTGGATDAAALALTQHTSRGTGSIDPMRMRGTSRGTDSIDPTRTLATSHGIDFIGRFMLTRATGRCFGIIYRFTLMGGAFRGTVFIGLRACGSLTTTCGDGRVPA